MIAADYLKRIAAWSRELNEREIEVARGGIVEKSYAADEYIFMRGDPFDYWTGIVTGLARMGTVSAGGKAASFAGLTAGAWFGEGSVLKQEPRRYDVMALRDTRLALMDRSTFFWLFRTAWASTAFWSDSSTNRSASSSEPWNMAARWTPPRGWRARSHRHRGAVRYLAPERQPMPEAAGERRAAPARIWRGDRDRPRAAV